MELEPFTLGKKVTKHLEIFFSTFFSNSNANSEKEEEKTAQPWYFHVVASFILVIHGLTFLVPHDPETEDTDMMRIIGKWFGFDWDWMKHFTPYAQVPKISSKISVANHNVEIS